MKLIKVNGKINLGFIKAFKFVDLKNDEHAIYIISHHKALPSNNSELTINLKLYQEIALNDSDFIIFEEVRDSSQ